MTAAAEASRSEITDFGGGTNRTEGETDIRSEKAST